MPTANPVLGLHQPPAMRVCWVCAMQCSHRLVPYSTTTSCSCTITHRLVPYSTSPFNHYRLSPVFFPRLLYISPELSYFAHAITEDPSFINSLNTQNTAGRSGILNTAVPLMHFSTYLGIHGQVKQVNLRPILKTAWVNRTSKSQWQSQHNWVKMIWTQFLIQVFLTSPKQWFNYYTAPTLKKGLGWQSGLLCPNTIVLL